MQPDEVTTRVLLVTTNGAFAEQVAHELRRESVEVAVVGSLDADVARAYDVVVAQDELADWSAIIGDRAPAVIALAESADHVAVASALSGGADDVITRTDRPHEAVARIRAVARRRPRPVRRGPALRVGDVELDPARREVLVRGRTVTLTRKQFDLLEFFLSNAGRVLTRGALVEHVWDAAADLDPNAVDVQVRRLRAAIEDDPRRPARLRTVRGIGFLYERGQS